MSRKTAAERAEDGLRHLQQNLQQKAEGGS
jgi:hypothetical protein